jgi:RsiW-degrading membrane proteinase PrsW (M82 family)
MQKRLKWRLIAPLAALGGGVLGVFGAVIQEVFYGSLFAAFVAGPMIEETMKPAGVYILYALQRDSVGGRWYRALLAALGGLSFAVIENIFYLMVYYPEHDRSLRLFRYTWTLGMHLTASFIVGLGINERLLRSVRGEVPFLSGNWRFFVIPMILHSLFNIFMVVLGGRWV